jgi:hypothetical protein
LRSDIRTTLLFLWVIVLGFLAGCTPERDDSDFFSPDAVDLLVIDAVLIVGEPLPMLRLSRSLAPDQPYNLENSAESGAAIVIRDGNGQETPYVGIEGDFGFYVPAVSPVRVVQPSTTYDLYVVTLEGEVLTATTLTPEPLAVDRWVAIDPATNTEDRELKTFENLGEAAYEAPENQIPYASVIVDAQVDDTGTEGFQIALFSLDEGSPPVIDPPFFDEEDFLELERNVSSPLIIAEEGGIRLPWFAIYFEGRHKYKVFSVDLNWYDYLRTTRQDGGGFGGNFGDGFETPIFHVEGGIGLFGSASVDSTGFTVLQAE